jgi:hypothetical protein
MNKDISAVVVRDDSNGILALLFIHKCPTHLPQLFANYAVIVCKYLRYLYY